MSCRFLVDAPSSGAWNMAVDEVLLDEAAAKGMSTLRFYNWSSPTVSLGYFQQFQDVQPNSAWHGCPVVRRLTGGGAIVHDREITYSLAVGAAQSWAREPERLYVHIHGALVRAMQPLGIAAVCVPFSENRATAALRNRRPASRGGDPFLCFHRRGPGDVIVDGIKVAGSAQRHRRGAVLQHGSLLLKRANAAPDLPGIECLCGVRLDWNQWVELWSAAIASELGLALEPQPLNAALKSSAYALVQSRYASAGWTFRK